MAKQRELKVSNYTVVSRSGTYEFKEEVQKLIRNGWQPYGSVSTCIDTWGKLVFSQALVVYEY